jgi:hypothetical protein
MTVIELVPVIEIDGDSPNEGRKKKEFLEKIDVFRGEETK